LQPTVGNPLQELFVTAQHPIEHIDAPEGGTIAVVDDDPFARRLLAAWLGAAGYQVREHASGASVLGESLAELDAVCLDLGLGNESGLDVLAHLHHRDPELPVLVVTADDEVASAVDAMRGGAYDYLTKPLERGRFEQAIRRAVERRGMARRLAELQRRTQERNEGSIIGSSARMAELRRQVARVAQSDVPVCVFGESGTGKELVARAIHQQGPRSERPFVAINCAAIPESLIESELFGHERGAFTGASAMRKGRFEQADGGTLFLDEVGEMSAATQARLLRTLQERTVMRLGGSCELNVDVRVVCATHRNLEEEVEQGRFREDLYYRLVVYPITVPALRERGDDIPLLFSHFLTRFARESEREVPQVDPTALRMLMDHRWPGNVRELQNVVRRCLLSCADGRLMPAQLPESLRGQALPLLPAAPDAPSAARHDGEILPLRVVEHRAIERALQATAGSVGKAAKMLGIGRATLYRRLASYQALASS
jgi:DNA-binding NtrC family response regulator